MKTNKRKTGMIIGIVCAVLAVAVLIGSMGSYTQRKTNAFDGSYLSYATTSSGLGGMFSNWGGGSVANALNVTGLEVGDRLEIANASVSLQTKMYDACTAAIKAKLKELEGRSDAYDEQNYQSGRQATIVARVPTKKLDAFLDSLGDNAVITSRTVSYSDVTDSFIDTESKKRALEAEQEALLELIGQANNVDEVMRVRQRLSEVHGELESYLKTLQNLQSQVEYSTVQIWVSEVDRISTPSQRFSALASSGFVGSVKNIGAGFRNFALWLIAAVPYLALLAIPATVGALLLRRAAKKRRANKETKAANQA